VSCHQHENKFEAIPHYSRGICQTNIRFVQPPTITITKGYIAIVVCFVTKVVDIEVITILSKEAFLAAQRRFIPRRGKPRTICSDNGTNFQGPAIKLPEIYKMFQSTSQMAMIQGFLSSEGFDWKFVPPHGPHFRGIWEAALKSMTYHLLSKRGSQFTTYEELCALLAEINDCLHSRILCALFDDPFNPSYLSSVQFLIREPLTQLPSADITDVKCNRHSRWQIYHQEIRQIWQRWSNDYLQTLQQLQCRHRTSPNLQPGVIVLLREENTTTLH